MNNIELGKKIREIRISKRMTQNDVVGTFITRNMLSQIENGTACPSIKTLEYIASVLEIPLEQLVASDSAEENQTDASNSENAAANTSGTGNGSADYIAILSMSKAKYMSKEYKEVINLLSSISDKSCPIYDEANALLARAYFELAKLSRQSNKLTEASKYANQTVIFAGNGIYSSDELMMKAYRIVKDTT